MRKLENARNRRIDVEVLRDCIVEIEKIKKVSKKISDDLEKRKLPELNPDLIVAKNDEVQALKDELV